PEVTLPPRKRLDITLGPDTRERRAHAYTRLLMETEARMSREAWVRATDASDLVHGQMSEIRELQAADRRRQTVISELLRIDHRRSTETSELRTALQGQVTALQGQGQQGLAGDPTQPELPEEAGVTAALAECDALRSTNGDDSHNSGTGVRRTERAARECTYTDFLKCQPLPFKGTEGVTSLSQWCERMESVFHISNCAAENQVKFATCTLHSVALTWWNTHVQTVGHEAAYELALLCGRMFSEEADKIEKYVGGLPDMIHGSVVASKPKMMQEAIEIATDLMDKKIRTFAERETASKRKRECPKLKNNNNPGNQGGRNNAPARVYAVGHIGTDPDANVVTGTPRLIRSTMLVPLERQHQNQRRVPERKKGGSASSTTPPTPIATPTPTTTIVAAPRLTTAAKGKQPARARNTTEPSDVERTEAEQLKIVLRRSRHETHISQQGSSSTDEGTGSEISKIGEQEATESDEGDDEATESDREGEDEKTREQEEESFDRIPQTPKESEDNDNNEEDQGLRIVEEERMYEE
nr:hypothetical protein [Tanacetum cinerariifolium]